MAYSSKQNRERRLRVISHYGGACACCGEAQLEFLAIDHKEGNGERHRQAVKARGTAMVNWIIRNDFPAMFRVLCHNCNQAIGNGGRCPHEGERWQRFSKPLMP